MPTERKKQIIDSLEETFVQSNSGIMADYRGLKTTEIVALRHKLRESGAELQVVKNTLALIAARKAGKDRIESILEGPVAIAFIKDDISVSAKAMSDYIASTKIPMTIKGGFLGNKMLTPEEVATIATLPSRQVLIGKVLGGIQGPLYAFMNQLNAPLRGLVTILQGRIKQLEGVN
ncbi:MAG: 50S ribosomal protein L10 [Dehalococcoidales bacterium]|nr:50S ribosomal protein L10 [Dehalococcoidales bacterium]